jgi:hypothetical protein
LTAQTRASWDALLDSVDSACTLMTGEVERLRTEIVHVATVVALLRERLARDPHLPFILISTDLRSQKIVDLPVKPVSHLSKPFTTEVFLDRVQEALRA